MAGERLIINGTVCFIDYADGDGEGSAVVNGITWRWEFHEYCGPFFMRKDGSERKRVPSEHHPVWAAFGAWHKKWLSGQKAKRRKRKSLDIAP